MSFKTLLGKVNNPTVMPFSLSLRMTIISNNLKKLTKVI